MKPKTIRQRYLVIRAFDYLRQGETYEFTYDDNRRHQTVDVRRIDGSGIGTYLRKWQLKQAIQNNWITPVND